LRVPLLRSPDAPSFVLEEDSAGGTFAIVGRGYPVQTATGETARAILPVGSVAEQIGASFGAYRVGIEAGVAGARAERRAGFVFAAMADRTVWQQDRWSATLGFGYEVVPLVELPAEKGDTSTYEGLVHGPRVTPALSFSLMPTVPRMRMPAGRR